MALKDVPYLSISWTRCKLLEDRNYICFIAFVPKAYHSPWLIANAQWVIVEYEGKKEEMNGKNEWNINFPAVHHHSSHLYKDTR